MRVVVRAAVPGDYAAFTRLFPELGVEDPVPSAARWGRELMPTTLIAQRENEAAGYLYRQRFDEVGYVRHLVTDPAQRRRGVGRALMLAARDRLLAEGAREWCLNVKADNVAALALYTSLGLARVFASEVWRLPWVALDRWADPDLAASASVSVRLLEVAEDPAFEARFGLLPGQLSDARRAERRLVVGAFAAEDPAAALVFDPTFPGCFPFRVARAELLEPVLRALLPYKRPEDPWVQLVVEGQPELSAALEAHGAERRLQLLNLRGPL